MVAMGLDGLCPIGRERLRAALAGITAPPDERSCV
jgi:hypothetical protein